MKRSDMEEKIYEELKGSIRFHFDRGFSKMDENLIASMVADILDIAEDAGMLPPVNWDTTDHCDCGCVRETSIKWDKE